MSFDKLPTTLKLRRTRRMTSRYTPAGVTRSDRTQIRSFRVDLRRVSKVRRIEKSW